MTQERKNKGENYTSFESPLKGDSLHIKLELSLGLLRLRNIAMQSTTLLPVAHRWFLPTRGQLDPSGLYPSMHLRQWSLLVQSSHPFLKSHPWQGPGQPPPPGVTGLQSSHSSTVVQSHMTLAVPPSYKFRLFSELLETQIQQAKEDAFFLLVRIPATIWQTLALFVAGRCLHLSLPRGRRYRNRDCAAKCRGGTGGQSCHHVYRVKIPRDEDVWELAIL